MSVESLAQRAVHSAQHAAAQASSHLAALTADAHDWLQAHLGASDTDTPLAAYWPFAADVQRRRASGAGALTVWTLVFDPPLPPLLAPLPNLFRLAAVMALLPILLVCLVEASGYVIVRTLGLSRRTVVVRTKEPLADSDEADATSLSSSSAAAAALHLPKAPLLTPGVYDAEALLRHRARSISGGAQSAEAAEAEWRRTGGSFARVTSVRAAAVAAASAAAAAAQGAEPGAAGAKLDATLSATRGETTGEEEGAAAATSPSTRRRRTLHPGMARASEVGVEGALGYFDTDVESGPESGRSSPVARVLRPLSSSSNSSPPTWSHASPGGASPALGAGGTTTTTTTTTTTPGVVGGLGLTPIKLGASPATRTRTNGEAPPPPPPAPLQEEGEEVAAAAVEQVAAADLEPALLRPHLYART